MILAKSMVSLSFDGAAVNMGDKNSVATRWLEVAPQAIIFHAVAHRLQNAWTDACGEVPYIFHVSECISDCFSLMNASMKKDAGFRDMAAVLQVSVVTLKSIHGIRWLASNARATGALLRDWLPLVAYFEKVALEKAKVLPSTAPSAKFIGAKVLIANGNGTPKPGRVVNVLKGASCPSGSAGRVSEEMGDQFTVVLDKKTGKSPKVEYLLPKNELVLKLAECKKDLLEDSQEFDLHVALTQYRFVVTLHFLLDIETILMNLSLGFQSNDLTPSSLTGSINDTYLRLDLMKDADGTALAGFFKEYNKEMGTFKGFNLEDPEAGQELFNQDRGELIDSTVAHLKGRFDPLLSSKVLVWMSDSFEHRRWPPKESPALKGWGVAALTSFANHYEKLQCMEGFDLPEALHQWSQMKSRLANEPFFRLSYKQFWEHVSCHYDSAYEFCEVLKPIREPRSFVVMDAAILRKAS